MRAHYAHRDYVRYAETLDDSDDDEGPTNEDAWLYEDLTILAKLYSRLKDREQLIALIFEVSSRLNSKHDVKGCGYLKVHPGSDLSILDRLQFSFPIGVQLSKSRL